MKKKKILEVCLQHIDDVKEAILFNQKNNYEYIIIDDTNLIQYESLAYLLRVGYEIKIYADKLTLVHKNYNYDIENVEK